MSDSYSIRIYSEGKELKLIHNKIITIDVMLAANKIPSAQLVIADGDIVKQQYELSDDDTFKPGNKIKIELGYLGDAASEALVFSGIIVKYKFEWNQIAGAILVINLKSLAFGLTTKRNSMLFHEMTDTEIIELIIRNSTKYITQFAPTKKVAKTTTKHKQMIQYHCTDWDFILMRAQANGLLVLFDYQNNTENISIVEPKLDSAKTHVFDINGSSIKAFINNFELEADIRYQYGSAQAIGWDISKLSVINKEAEQYNLYQGNLESVQLAKLIGADQYRLVHLATLEETELEAWANAKLQQSRLKMLSGRFQIQGKSDISLGDSIQIKGVPEYFIIRSIITGIRHQFSNESGWLTHIQFGFPTNELFADDDIIDKPAANLLPAVTGLQVATILGYEKEKNPQFLVKINLPIFDKKDDVVLARLISPYASKKKGLVFRPEVGDEVVVGFFNNDPRYPVILGSMHSEKNSPPIEMSEENTKKGIVIDENLHLLIDAEEGKVGFYIESKNAKLNLTEKGMIASINNDIKIESPNQVTIKGNSIEFE